MADRQERLMDAIEGMSVQYPVYFDEDVLGRLLSGAAPERVLLGALVEMVDRCLDRYESGPIRYDDGVDTLAQSAGEEAVLTLAEFGLMDRVSARLGRWTPEGKRFWPKACKSGGIGRIKSRPMPKQNSVKSMAERVRITFDGLSAR